MHIDTAGTYTLQYTAADSCGNETIEERTVEVLSLKTTLFTDGTFIINEKSSHRAANIALHGAVTNEYAPWNPNGSSATTDRYSFASASQRPWHNQRSQVTAVEVDSEVSPGSMQYWFRGFSNCTSLDTTNIDTSNCTSFLHTFYACSTLTSLDVSHFDTSKATNMNQMFMDCPLLTSLDVSHFDTSKVTNIESMFSGCSSLTSIDVSNFNTELINVMGAMFAGCSTITSLDLSNFDTDTVTSMIYMFADCQSLTELDLSSFRFDRTNNITEMFRGCSALTTIFVAPQTDLSATTSKSRMFASCSALVGGAGTAYATAAEDSGTYARVDNPPDAPGYFTAKP